MSNVRKNDETPDKTETSTEVKDGKIGTMLHDVRIKKKLAIEDISKALRIKVNYLTAIEESDYDNIPAAPYGIGFIRSYATYLGLNSSRIVQIFKEETKQENSTVTQAKPLITENSETETPEAVESSDAPSQKYILTGTIMLLLVYAVWQLSVSKETAVDMTTETIVEDGDQNYPIQVENYVLDNEEDNTEPTQQINVTEDNFEEEEETVKEVTAPDISSKETIEKPQQENILVDTKPQKTGRVVLKIKKETWVEVKDEDKLWISKVLKAGDEYVVPDNGEGKTVSFGNTDGVDVVIDGKIVTIVSNNKKTNIQLDAFLGNH